MQINRIKLKACFVYIYIFETSSVPLQQKGTTAPVVKHTLVGETSLRLRLEPLDEMVFL